MLAARRALTARTFVMLFACLPLFAAAASGPASQQTIARDANRVAPKAYNVGGALALRDDVGYGFQSVNGPVRIDIGRITNESTTTISGTVRAALFLTTTPTPSGTYYIIARSDLGTLGPGQFFGPISHTVPFLVPPDGTYYVHMGAFEFEAGLCNTPDGYCLDDFVSFTARVQVSNGQIFDAGPPPPTTADIVEYYNTNFNHYFVTAYANEIALLDAGQFQGWVRTGRTFPVWVQDDGTLYGVCRFFSASFAPKSSHFYTPYADECATVNANPAWTFEAIAFYVELPSANGSCAPGRQPVYRLYNNGQSGAPNHRYTVSLSVRDQMLAQGWVPEGVGVFGTIACVPI